MRAFMRCVQYPRQQECAAYLRHLLEGSQFTREHASLNVQDAYTLRCIPQVHGAVRDAVAYARWISEIEPERCDR